MAYKNVRIKEGWEGEGKSAVQIGGPSVVNGQFWTPVVFENEEEPEFFKTAGLEEF